MYARPLRVDGDKILGLLALSGGPDGWPRALLLAVESEGAWEVLGLCARRPARARGALGGRKADVDHTLSPSGPGLRPADAFAPLGTGYRLLFPVEAEVCHLEAFASFFLPATIFVGRFDEIDLAGMAPNEVATADVSGVRQLLGGQKPAFRKPFLHVTKLFYVGGGGRIHVDVSDQMRQPFVATLRETHFVANPTHPRLVQ